MEYRANQQRLIIDKNIATVQIKQGEDWHGLGVPTPIPVPGEHLSPESMSHLARFVALYEAETEKLDLREQLTRHL